RPNRAARPVQRHGAHSGRAAARVHRVVRHRHTGESFRPTCAPCSGGAMCFRLMGVGGEDAGWTQPMTGEAMRIREGATASERRLFQDDREIGYIRGATVGFVGFTTEADAVEAAHSADRALERRRSRAGWLASTIGGATVAQLVRVEAAPGTVWGFE